jgi:hypothetical protein
MASKEELQVEGNESSQAGFVERVGVDLRQPERDRLEPVMFGTYGIQENLPGTRRP